MTDFQAKLISVSNMNEKTKGLINESDAKHFEALTKAILDANKTHNLTAIRDEDGFILKHIVDSCACVPYIEGGNKICDVGCGGGFPSFVIASLCKDASITSIDSVGKKIRFLQDACASLPIPNMTAINGRAEEMGQNKIYRESFDIATARAVGRLNLICELCLPLVKVGGKFLAMKSLSTDEELEEAKRAIELLGGALERVDHYSLTDGSESLDRTIVVIKKIKGTPSIYPRNNSQISKKPL